MSFKDLNISTVTLTDLYKSSLVSLEEERNNPKLKSEEEGTVPKTVNKVAGSTLEQPKPVPEELRVPRYLGEHKRKVSLLVRFEKDTHISDLALEMLSKMLGACRLNLADVAIINTAKQEFTMGDIKKSMSPQVVMLFGQDQQKLALPFVFPDFKIQLHDQVTYLSAPDLGYLATSDPTVKELKMKLWNNLKTIFNV
ncbi:MAG: hypothetical protein K2P88_13300 [Chitinophagaceae bacterium]|nr:hypothetical protein [Chitinophagaceae bacterium]